MFPIIGIIIVTGAVIGGYLIEHGNMSVIFQPVELMIIGGAAVGSFVIASPLHVIKAVGSSFLGMFTHSPRTKKDYTEILLLLNGIFYKKFTDTENIKFQYLNTNIDSAKNNFEKNNYYAILYLPDDFINKPLTGTLFSDKQPSISVKSYIENVLKKEMESMKLFLWHSRVEQSPDF